MSSEESKKDIDPVIQIWTKLNQLFGNKVSLASIDSRSPIHDSLQTNQVFAMEYPGRILDMGNFAYKGSDDVEAQQTKPQAVVESEFRLCDDIYDIGMSSSSLGCFHDSTVSLPKARSRGVLKDRRYATAIF